MYIFEHQYNGLWTEQLEIHSHIVLKSNPCENRVVQRDLVRENDSKSTNFLSQSVVFSPQEYLSDITFPFHNKDDTQMKS